MKVNNIHCLALNYRGIGVDDQSPIYFLKSTSCISHDGMTITYPRFEADTSKVWTEVELGIRILKECDNVSEDEVCNYIEGFFIAGDITCSNIHGRDHHLAFSKARNGFAPISKLIKKLDLRDTYLKMETYINNELKQVGTTADMILNPYQSISYLSKLVKLQKGDIILTGTPSTINGGPQVDCIVSPGDQIKHTIQGLGELNYKFSI